jgi:hypothetical protein
MLGRNANLFVVAHDNGERRQAVRNPGPGRLLPGFFGFDG